MLANPINGFPRWSKVCLQVSPFWILHCCSFLPLPFCCLLLVPLHFYVFFQGFLFVNVCLITNYCFWVFLYFQICEESVEIVLRLTQVEITGVSQYSIQSLLTCESSSNTYGNANETYIMYQFWLHSCFLWCCSQCCFMGGRRAETGTCSRCIHIPCKYKTRIQVGLFW